jgi:hypothetical protein
MMKRLISNVQFSSRVNFQKYHQSYDHLKSSSVYRMIHETETRCPGAFEGRPEKIPALEEYKQLLQACTHQVKEFYVV